jgi:Ca2+-binding RTX toxin-like protein
LTDGNDLYQSSNLSINTMTPELIRANVWDTRMLYMDVIDTGDDTLDGGSGNDFVIGQVWRLCHAYHIICRKDKLTDVRF